VQGFPYGARLSWPSQLDSFVRASGAAVPRVEARAERGWGTAQLRERLDGWLAEDPVAVILCAGENEFLGLEGPFMDAPEARERWPSRGQIAEREKAFRENLDWMTQRVAAAGAQPFVRCPMRADDDAGRRRNAG